MNYAWRFLIGALLFASCKQAPKMPNHVLVQTSEGDFTIKLFADRAPKTCAAFLTNIKAGVYDKTSFYRVLSKENQPTDAFKAQLIQGGLWKSKKKPESIKGIPHESTDITKILHKPGIVSMARMEPGTATTEFFVCLGDEPGFDYGGENNADKLGYAAFGKVVDGMETVLKIYAQPERNQYFLPRVRIHGIKSLE